MPLFSDLRSDYPLNLTLLERPYAGALKQSYRAGLTLAREVPVPLAGSKWWFLSRRSLWVVLSTLSITPARMVAIAIRLSPESAQGPALTSVHLCGAPSASESTCGLTQVRASLREFRRHIDAQRPRLVEHRHAHLRGNAEFVSRELAARSLSPRSAACVVVAVHMLSASGRHSPITKVPCPAFQMRNSTEGVDFGSVTISRAYSWIAGKSDQPRRSTLCLKAEEQ
jgi:hypothetical protein